MGKVAGGIDIGSVTTKVLLIDPKPGGDVLSLSIVRSGGDFKNALNAALTESLRLAGLRLEEVGYMVATGYGRGLPTFAHGQVTEITCHARGARHLFPEANTVIDIGGQDSKVIRLGEGGGAADFVMNDKCAAGTGRFLEVIAAALEIDIDEIGSLSFQSRNDVQVSSVCTVFAESEVVSLLSKGHSKVDIAAAIHNAISRRIAGMVWQLGLKERVVITGGVAKNPGVVRSLERILGTTFLIPEEPQITGALGAALIAAKRFWRGLSPEDAPAGS